MISLLNFLFWICKNHLYNWVAPCRNLGSVPRIHVEWTLCVRLLRAHVSAPLGDMATSLFPFGKTSASPPFPPGLLFLVSPLSLMCMAIGSHCGKGCWKKIPMSGNSRVSGGGEGGGHLWRGDGDKVGRAVDVPVGLSLLTGCMS